MELEMTILMSAVSPESAPEFYGAATPEDPSQPRNIYLRGIPLRDDGAVQMEECELNVGPDLSLCLATYESTGDWRLCSDAAPFLPNLPLAHPGMKPWDEWRFGIVTVMFDLKKNRTREEVANLVSLDSQAMWSE